ncbi:MAG: multiheme c-type cytochrome [Halopseudomonas sp.]
MQGSSFYRLLTVTLLSVWLVSTSQADSSGDFLAQHWQRPLAPQGDAPTHYSELEASLSPNDCGSCHPQQRADWSQSLHSRAMGPGLMGQLIDMPAHATGDHQSCLRCHAPLAEQAQALVNEIESGNSQGLHREGLICAACHVRQHQRFGPARQDGSTPDANTPLPHNGWTATDAFEDSRFCAACHQFEPDEFALNGKLLEDTYNEWLNSPYAEQGVSCQSCHMPERRHLWRGIHDPEMVRQGVDINAQTGRISADQIEANLTISNSGTGHRFPTYVTPQVVLEGYQEDRNGARIAGSESYFVVARRVAMDLSEEIFDTRLAPGESAVLDYSEPRSANAVNLVMRIWVEPDFFYQHFYDSVLSSGQAQRGKAELEQAFSQASESRYTLFEQRLPLEPTTASR